MKEEQFQNLVIQGLRLIVRILWAGMRDKACSLGKDKEEFLDDTVSWLEGQ